VLLWDLRTPGQAAGEVVVKGAHIRIEVCTKSAPISSMSSFRVMSVKFRTHACAYSNVCIVI
jgi:hypothetical protein